MHHSNTPLRTDACEVAPSASLSARGLSKRFGAQAAVEALSFEVPPGQIVGLLGPNGAGKSTLLKMLTGILPPSAGAVHICGFDLAMHAVEAKRRMGFAPESAAIFESLTALEYLRLIGALYGISRAALPQRLEASSHWLDLGSAISSDKLLGAYSKGMRRKLVITAALLHGPPVLLFDEPLDGLDPDASLGFTELMLKLAGEGTTILFSTHLLDVVERLCDRVIIIDGGRMLLDGAPAELVAAAGAGTLPRLFSRVTGEPRPRDASLSRVHLADPSGRAEEPSARHTGAT